MNEQEFQELFYKYLDGELNDKEVQEVEQYLESNPLSQIALEKEKNFDDFIRQHLIKKEMPYDVREQIIKSIDDKAAKSFSWRNWFQPVWKPAGVFLASCILIFSLFLNNSESFPIFSASVDRHMDVLNGAYPMEIVSGDIDEVNRWFEGKMNFAVQVPNILNKRCKLLGARICHLQDKKVALITFDVSGRRMTAFVIDTHNMDVPKSKKYKQEDQVLYSSSNKGYQSVLCLNKEQNGVGCIYVSDMPEQELLSLVKL